MMYVGELPWHGMGKKLPMLATAKEALDAAGLNWNVKKEQQERKGVKLPDEFWTVREDTDTVLGCVGSQYKVFGNVEAFDFMDSVMMDAHGPKYETAGSLWGGSKVWALARIPDELEIVKGDLVNPYLLLCNTHDGSGSMTVRITPIRVVCNNTLTAAFRGKFGPVVNIRHSGDLKTKLAKAQEVLGIAKESMSETLGLYQALAKREPTKDEIETVMGLLFKDTKTERAKLQRERVLELAETGMGNGNTGVRGTGWALYNGYTELVDHVANKGSRRDDASDMRTNSMWFDSGAKSKAEALEIITKVLLN
jgi:phage/plasmid-like protein (TIGR03299 family)